MTPAGPAESLRVDLPDLAEGVMGFEPSSAEEVASILRYATEGDKAVDVLGGGTRHGFGSPPPPDIVMSMRRLDSVNAWDPDDMTVVVGAGMPVGRLEGMLAERSQTAVLPEIPGESTVGGSVSAGASPLRRGRLLGIRERVLEVTLVTGDGRIVRAGGQVVKNVTGYDLPRLVVGAFGSLGVITELCFKLWPVPPGAVTVSVDDLAAAEEVARPLAVLETNDKRLVFLWGTESEVDALTTRLGGSARSGHHWPEDPRGSLRWSLRVAPAQVGPAIEQIPPGWRYLAVHQVGDIRLASDSREGASELRKWAEGVGGHLVVVDAPPAALPGFDPWGAPPPALDIQRRLIAQFDPARIINPGRLPGGL